MKKRTVVIGGCGFIGSYIVKQLLNDGYEVIVIDNLSSGKKENIPESVPLYIIDITKEEELRNYIQKGDVIFHLAALTSVPKSIEKPLTYAHTNITGTHTVLEVARQNEASGVIFSSSAAIYGNQEGIMEEERTPKPESPYALHKYIGERLCEQYTKLYNLPTVSLRYFNVYGKGNHETGSYAPVTARFLKAKREGLPLPVVGDGKQTRDFVHVEDVALANVRSIELLQTKTNVTINVCSNESVSVLDIATLFGGEIAYLPPRNEIRHSLGDNNRMRTLLKITPKKLDEGITPLF